MKNLLPILIGYKKDIKAQQSTYYMKKEYELTNRDAKILSEKGYEGEQPIYILSQCREEMKKQMAILNTKYKYHFDYSEAQADLLDKQCDEKIKRMTRTIYLIFQCQKCKNQWTTIAGTFQITFYLNQTPFDLKKGQLFCALKDYKSLRYHIKIYGMDCKNCKNTMIPLIYHTQMEAMKIFFSVIITNILDEKKPPKKPSKYYIKQYHHHKKEWCQACKQGYCTTQNNRL